MKYLTRTLPNYRGHETGRPETCHRSEETKGKWSLIAIRYPILDPGTEKYIFGKTGEIKIVCSLDNSIIPVLISKFCKMYRGHIGYKRC